MGKRKKPMGINQYLHRIGAYEKCTPKERQQMRKTFKETDSKVKKALGSS